MDFDRFPVRRVEVAGGGDFDASKWPATIPAVAQVAREGLTLGAATVFVGENGSGKSTLVEAIAAAYGLAAEGGSTGSMLSTRKTESPLAQHLLLVRNTGATRRGYFLRGETAHGLFTYLEEHPGGGESAYHEMSHGESFLRLVDEKFREHGLWVLDEPEAALSFRGCLHLLAFLRDKLATGRSQVVLSTHSPVLASLPGATVLEAGEWGLRSVPWNESELVMSWRAFLARPAAFLDRLD